MSTKQKSQDKNKMSEIDDQIMKHFEIKKRLGKGAYGIVWKAIDKKNNQTVAVKKIFDAFRNETDAQRTFREIMFLRAFRNHPNVIQLYSTYKAINNLDIYLSFEFMESDLHNVIKRGSILKDVHKRYVMYQLLNAIKYIHSGNVIHRDLKPSNVLIDSKCRCKIADFGLARSVSHRQFGESNNNIDPSEPILTDYVATRWYRAPEILVASKRYTKGIDMWSLGCILGEMIRGKPLFPGSSTVNQIERIVCALPEITEKDVSAVGAGFGSVLLNQQINSNNNPKLDDLLVGAPEDSKQLVKSLLVLDPARRHTAKQALAHKYVEKFRHTIPEAELNTDVLPPFRDDVQLTVPEYRSKLYEIMQSNEKGGGGGCGVVGKQVNRKIRDISTVKLENTITVTSSSLPNASKAVSAKPQEVDKKSLLSNQNSSDSYIRRADRKGSLTTQNSSQYMLTKLTSNPSNTPAIATCNGYNSSHSNDIKYKPVPKIKYCKISNIPDTKISVGNGHIVSERADTEHMQHSQSYLNCLGKTGSVLLEKRHSVDGSFSADLPFPSSGLSSEKKSMHGSFRNVSNARSSQPERAPLSKDGLNCTSCSSKYFSTTAPSETGETPIEKTSVSPPTKITKNESASLSNESGSYYERRLRNLEERIQRHKMDINALFSQNTKQKLEKYESNEANGYLLPGKKSLSLTTAATNSSTTTSVTSNGKHLKTKVNLNRSKSENASSSIKQRSSVRFDYTFSEGDRMSTKYKASGVVNGVAVAPSGGEYGVVTAKELYDLRKSQVI